MTIDLNWRPRLVGMNRLVPQAPIVSLTAEALEGRRKTPSVTPAATFESRQGYQDDFLGGFVVPWPKPAGQRAEDVYPIPSAADNRLDYTHFSLIMSRSRRMAMFVGVNISGSESVSIDRQDDKWFFDGRLPIEAQLGDDLYADNLLDRGHLVRREDPNWGGDAQTANEDTFHFTNCSPQMAGFNQKTWLSLENYILQNTRRWKERATVFSGPVFRDDDRTYRGARIPSAYWKVVAFVSDTGQPSATAYMIDQSRELGSLEAAFGVFKTYQRSVARIEELTDIDFGALSQFDGFSNEELATGTRIETEIRGIGDVRV